MVQESQKNVSVVYLLNGLINCLAVPWLQLIKWQLRPFWHLFKILCYKIIFTELIFFSRTKSSSLSRSTTLHPATIINTNSLNSTTDSTTAIHNTLETLPYNVASTSNAYQVTVHQLQNPKPYQDPVQNLSTKAENYQYHPQNFIIKAESHQNGVLSHPEAELYQISASQQPKAEYAAATCSENESAEESGGLPGIAYNPMDEFQHQHHLTKSQVEVSQMDPCLWFKSVNPIFLGKVTQIDIKWDVK